MRLLAAAILLSLAPAARVIGPVSNLPEFRKAFGCAASAPMVRPSEERCEIW